MNRNELIADIEKLWFNKGHLNETERDFMIDLFLKHKPSNCLEIGFATGRSAVTALIAAKPTRLVSIEINLDYMGARSYANNLLASFPNYQIYEGDSKALLTSKFFKDCFPDNLDFVFVDGGHSYVDAYTDIKNVYPYLNVGGLIVVDDYKSGPPEGCPIPEVDKAVEDFHVEHKDTMEISSWYDNGKGCAILKRIK